MEIRFSAQGNGACPLCISYKNCKILEKMTALLLEEVKEKSDSRFEAVIYRCPEFVEHSIEEDSPPFAN